MPFSTQQRHDALTEPVRLLDVRVAGQDELVDPRPVVLLEPVRDLLVAADQRRTGAAADQAHAGPQVGRHLELRASVYGTPVAQRQHPLLPGRLAGVERGFCALATVSGSSPSSSHCACCQASSEASRERVWIRSPNRRVRPSASASSRIHVDLLAHQLQRLTPRQVDVGVLGRDRAGGSRRSAEVDVRRRRDPAADLGTLDLEELAAEVERRQVPGAAHHGEELLGLAYRSAFGAVSPNLACSRGSPPVTMLIINRPLEIRWYAAAICAASTGLITPGRNATRNFSRDVSRSRAAVRQPGVLAERAGGREHSFEAVQRSAPRRRGSRWSVRGTRGRASPSGRRAPRRVRLIRPHQGPAVAGRSGGTSAA